MDLVLAATWPWHVWIGLLLVIGGVGLVIATIVGYVVKVSSAKYPRD